MALPAGTMSVTVTFAQGLKDKDWFGRCVCTHTHACMERCAHFLWCGRHGDGGYHDPLSVLQLRSIAQFLLMVLVQLHCKSGVPVRAKHQASPSASPPALLLLRCRQDPYAIVRCGGQQFRTRTHVDGGRNPVWNETFTFQIINDNSLELTVMDADVGRDDLIGTATVSLARAREQGSDSVQAPVVCKHSRKQHGFVAVNLRWMPNDALRPGASHHGYGAYYQQQPAAPQQLAACNSYAYYAANGYAPPAPYHAAPAAAYSYPYTSAPAPAPAAYPAYPQQQYPAYPTAPSAPPPVAAGYPAPSYYYGQPPYCR